MFSDPTTDPCDDLASMPASSGVRSVDRNSIPAIAAPLSADQESILEDIAAFVRSELTAPHPSRAIEAAVGASGQCYLAAMIAALAVRQLHDCCDPIGAAMLQRWALEFARHECTVV